MDLSPKVKNWIEEDFDTDLATAKEHNRELIEVFEHCKNQDQQLLLLRGHIFYNSRPNFYKAPHLYSSGFFEPHVFNSSDPSYSERYQNDMFIRVVKWDMNIGEWVIVSSRSVQIRKEVDPNNRYELKNFGLKVLSISEKELNEKDSLEEFYFTLNSELRNDIKDYMELKKLKFH